MAMSHADCSHDRTPAGRAACRKQTAEFDQAVGKTPLTSDRVMRALPDRHQQAVRVLDAGQPARARNTPRKAASGQLKRPGTMLRNTHDLADVPRRLASPIRDAWSRGWHVRIGEQFTEGERRIEIIAPYGVIALVWRTSTPHGVWGVFWRATGNPITHRIDNVNQAFRLGANEEEEL